LAGNVLDLGYRVGRGLAEQLGAVDPKGRGFGLSRNDVGLDVTGYIESDKKEENRQREKLPAGHRFFQDCERETNAKQIEWMMTRENFEAWFITLTFKNYVSEVRAWRMLTAWFRSVADGYERLVKERQIERSQGLNWAVAQEWQKRDVIHFHIILSGVRLGILSRMRQESRWSGMGGGFARVYDASLKAAPYLAKYTGKTYHNGAISWGGTSRWHSPPLSISCCRALIPG